MEHEMDRATRAHNHQATHHDDDWEPIELTSAEGAAVARLLGCIAPQDAKRFAASDREALLMLVGADKLLNSLRAAGYCV